MMTLILLAFVVALVLAALLLIRVIRARNMQIWLGSYLRRRRPARPTSGPVHVMFCFVDHFEPAWGKVDLATQRARVDRWCRDYRVLASAHRDADGRTSAARKKFVQVSEQLLGFEGKPESYELIRARNRFYNCLVDIGGNDALARVLPSMSVHLIRVQFRAFQKGRDRFADYRQMSEAVLAGDARRAELAGRRHVRRLGSNLDHLPDAAFAPD